MVLFRPPTPPVHFLRQPEPPPLLYYGLAHRRKTLRAEEVPGVMWAFEQVPAMPR